MQKPTHFPFHFFVLVQHSKPPFIFPISLCLFSVQSPTILILGQGAIKRKFYCQESSRKKKGILSRLILPTKQVAPTLTMHLRLLN